MSYQPRLIEPLVRSALKSFPALVLTGSRQSGKTTLLRHLLGKTHHYVLLDDLDVRGFADQDPKAFLERHPTPVILDEIQNAPKLLSYIKTQIEKDRRPGRWALLGSQQFSMMKHVSESLAGRAAVLHLHPFSISESFRAPVPHGVHVGAYIRRLTHPPLVEDIKRKPLGEWLLRGLYPEVVEKPSMPLTLWYASYVQTYLDRDVRGNIKETNLLDFRRFLRLLASRTAQELNQSSLSKELGLSIPTIRSWISLLEASSLVFLLPPYHRNYGKRVIKNPKLYFMDTGLVAHLVGLQTPEHLLAGPMAGALFESAIVANFKKLSDALGSSVGLYFWRAIGGVEVDLLLESGNELYPMEIKLASTLTPYHYAGLQAWQRLSGNRSMGLMVSTSKEVGLIGSNIINWHWSLL